MSTADKSSNSSSNNNKPTLIVSDPTKGVKVNAGVVAKPFRDEIKAKVEAMKQAGFGKFMLGVNVFCVEDTRTDTTTTTSRSINS